MTFRETVLLHCARFPRLTVQDLVKLSYQSAFGSGHMMPDPAAMLAYLKRELAQTAQTGGELLTPIGGGLFRLNLCAMEESGLRAETVAGLFRHAAGSGDFEEYLRTLEEMAGAGELPVSPAELGAYLVDYRGRGCPAVHHSDTYRDAYHPAYRIVPGETEYLLPLLQKIDALLNARTGKKPVRVAIDGMSAAGKSTLGAFLSDVYGANLFHMDDFFLPEERKTPERLAESGGNVDYERFRAEVAQQDTGEAFSYRPYRCHPAPAGYLPEVKVEPRALSIVEGAYSLHHALRDGYDLKVFYRIDPALQRERILARNGEDMLQRFLNEWIPLENAYIEAEGLIGLCDFVLDSSPIEK